jgi:branched-chain amino acid aminotransferase
MPENAFAPRHGLKVWVGEGVVPVEQAVVSVFDHALLYGDGVFEGIRIYRGRIFKEQEHIQRFIESAKVIRLNLPMNAEQLSRAMYETMRANDVSDGYIRLVATRGVGALGISIRRTANPSIIIIADKISLYPAEVYERHCTASSQSTQSCEYAQPADQIAQLPNNVLAKAEPGRQRRGDHAGHRRPRVRMHRRQHLHHSLLTTPVDGRGFSRNHPRRGMELARKRGMTVLETSLVRHDLLIAEECFATGTAAEIVPITEINKIPIGDGKPGRITKQLMEDFVTYRNAG